MSQYHFNMKEKKIVLDWKNGWEQNNQMKHMVLD